MEPRSLSCIACGSAYPLAAHARACPACGEAGIAANLTVAYDEPAPPARGAIPARPRSLWRFAAMLPLGAADAVSLGEGATPLVPTPGLGPGRVLVKDETRNPTWSFKDRLASVAVSWARRAGARVIAASSTGNAGAAAAAYAARAGLACVVFTAPGASGPNLAQIRAAGAMTLECATMEDRWAALGAAVSALGWFPTTPLAAPAAGSNPIGIEGYKTIAYEIAEALDWRAPDWCVLPVCYGDGLFGLWKGFEEMRRWGWTESVPRLVAAEVSGSLAVAMKGDGAMPPTVGRAEASVAVSIDTRRSTAQALAALRRSDGRAVAVDDAAVLAARDRLARAHGLFVEASSAAAFAALDRLEAEAAIGADETVVAVATASGLKDAGAGAAPPVPRLAVPDVAGIRRALEEAYGFDA